MGDTTNGGGPGGPINWINFDEVARRELERREDLVPEAVDPVRELPKPLSQLSLEERQAWAFRLKAIRAAYDRFREPPAAKTVLRPWVKIALALLAYVAIAAVLSFIGCILPVVPLLHLL